MTFLITLTLALLGIALAAGAVRAAFSSGPLSWPRAVAVAAVALVGATGLANAGDSFRQMKDRRERWAPVDPDAALNHNAAGGVDPAFIAFAKPHLLRGDTYFLSHSAGNETRLWMNYRLAPIMAVSPKEKADWIIYWGEPDPFKTHEIAPDQVVTHLKWGPEHGLIRVRRS